MSKKKRRKQGLVEPPWSESWVKPEGVRNKDWSGTTEPLPLPPPKPDRAEVRRASKVYRRDGVGKPPRSRRPVDGVDGWVGARMLPPVLWWHALVPPWEEEPAPGEIPGGRPADVGAGSSPAPNAAHQDP